MKLMTTDSFACQSSLLLILLLTSILLTGCKKKGPVGEDEKETERISLSKEIGTNGGTIGSEDGAVSLEIPDGSLDTSLTITVKEIDYTGSNEEVIPGKIYDFGPSGTQFAQPVQLQMNYDPTSLPNDVPEDSLVIVKFHENGDQQIFNTHVDKKRKTLSTSIRSFSSYGPNFYKSGPCISCTFDKKLTGEYNPNRSIDLSWESIVTNMNIEVHRAVVQDRFVAYDSDYQRIAVLPGQARNFTDNNIGNEGAFYFYRLRRISGNRLYDFSNGVRVTVLGTVDSCTEFTISPGTQTAVPNEINEFEVTINRQNGFTGSVSLSLESKNESLPLEEIFAGYSFQPNPTTENTTLSYNISSVWNAGKSFQLTLKGTATNSSTTTSTCEANLVLTVGTPTTSPTSDPEVFTLAGTGAAGFADGPGDQAQFNTAFGLASDPETGNIYVADLGNHRIRVITPDGTVSTLAGSGDKGTQDGNLQQAEFDSPSSIAVDRSGNSTHLYVADYANDLIRRIDLDNNTVITYAGTTRGYQDGAADQAQFHYPIGLTIVDGVLYFTDSGNNAIRFITIEEDPADAVVATLAGHTAVMGDADGANDQAQFYSPFDLYYDEPNVLFYVADRMNHTIRTVSSTTTSTPTLLIARNFAMRHPTSIIMDDNENIYVSEQTNSIIRKIFYIGSGYYDEEIFVGSYQEDGYVDDVGEDARLHYPSGMIIAEVEDETGQPKKSLVFCDAYNYAIRYIPLE